MIDQPWAEAEVERAIATVPDLGSDVEFTLSTAGLMRREDREIAYAAEIKRLRLWLDYIEGNHRDARECAREALDGKPNPYQE